MSQAEAFLAGSTNGGQTSLVEVASEMLKDNLILITLSRRLDSLPKFKLYAAREETNSPVGLHVKSRAINGVQELTKLPNREWVYQPNYRNYRALTRQTRVRQRFEYVDKKQLLYLLVDASGSMRNGYRIAAACGIVFNRLRAVVEGKASLYLRFFSTELLEEHTVTTPEQARELLQVLKNQGVYEGNGTDISKCLIQTCLRIQQLVEEEANFVRPELVIISDGCDEVTSSLEDLRSTTLHAFIIESTNSKLLTLARQSGGVGVDYL